MLTAVGQRGVAEEVVTQLSKDLDKPWGIVPWKHGPAVTSGAFLSGYLEGD